MALIRVHARVAALLAGLLLGLPVLSVSADGTPSRYLALGDSVPFGYSPLLDPHNANNFVGYPEAVANHFANPPVLANASCPGEASGGFISFLGVDNVCRPYRFLLGYPLHVSYSTPQLEYAVTYLHQNPRTDLITMMIGANDLFVLQNQCGGNPDCILAGLPALLNDLAANLTTIYSAIRGAGFRGSLVAVTYYVTDYTDPLATGVIGAINQVLGSTTVAFGGVVADGFAALFAVARLYGGDSCAAGLLIALPAGGCDIHPSPAGRDLLAGAVLTALGDPPAGHGPGPG